MLYEAELFGPLIDTFVRALPHAFRDADAPERTHVAITVRLPEPGGEARRYSLVREPGRWALFQPLDAKATATVTTDGEVAWCLFTKGIAPDAAMARSTVEGDGRLGEKFFDAVAVIA